MLMYNCGALSAESVTFLASKQALVDNEADRKSQYEKATALFRQKVNNAFKEVKLKLAKVSPPGDSCFYCERDRYRDIEHVQPKRHFPERAFAWENYLYACTICNQDAKNDKFAIFDAAGNIIEFDRSLAWTDPVPTGTRVIIDPRTEDPLDFLQLDLTTGIFIPIGQGTNPARGKYTRDLFDLNNTTLAKIRRSAFYTFNKYLQDYEDAIKAGDNTTANNILTEILELPHPTVLAEMRRQANSFPLLSRLFPTLPAKVGARIRAS